MFRYVEAAMCRDFDILRFQGFRGFSISPLSCFGISRVRWLATSGSDVEIVRFQYTWISPCLDFAISSFRAIEIGAPLGFATLRVRDFDDSVSRYLDSRWWGVKIPISIRYEVPRL